MAAADSVPVDLGSLSIDQLNALRKSLSDEIQHLTGQFGTLKVAASRYQQSLSCLASFDAKNLESPILVPLTSSMYVPGTLASVETVMVDVGTGYFVEKTIPDAVAFFKGKMTLLQQNIKLVEKSIMRKNRDTETVGVFLKTKVQQSLQEQESRRGLA